MKRLQLQRLLAHHQHQHQRLPSSVSATSSFISIRPTSSAACTAAINDNEDGHGDGGGDAHGHHRHRHRHRRGALASGHDHQQQTQKCRPSHNNHDPWTVAVGPRYIIQQLHQQQQQQQQQQWQIQTRGFRRASGEADVKDAHVNPKPRRKYSREQNLLKEQQKQQQQQSDDPFSSSRPRKLKYNDKGHPNYKSTITQEDYDSGRAVKLVSIPELKEELKELEKVRPMERHGTIRQNEQGKKQYWSRACMVGKLRAVHPAQKLMESDKRDQGGEWPRPSEGVWEAEAEREGEKERQQQQQEEEEGSVYDDLAEGLGSWAEKEEEGEKEQQQQQQEEEGHAHGDADAEGNESGEGNGEGYVSISERRRRLKESAEKNSNKSKNSEQNIRAREDDHHQQQHSSFHPTRHGDADRSVMRDLSDDNNSKFKNYDDDDEWSRHREDERRKPPRKSELHARDTRENDHRQQHSSFHPIRNSDEIRSRQRGSGDNIRKFDNNDKWSRHGKDETKPPAPTVRRGPMTSITVSGNNKGSQAQSQSSDGKGDDSKYCYGCGATIIQQNKQRNHGPTESETNNTNNNISMGLKSSAGSYWHEKNEEKRISQMKNWALCSRCKALQKGHVETADGNAGPVTGDEVGQMIDSSTTIDTIEALSPSHEMTQVFREQVSKIRAKPDAVVILCIDATNPHGTTLSKLRNYVGGNPILLAVTRCDLLPDYVRRGWSAEKEERVKGFFKRLAGELNPAEVYLCSVDVDDDGNDNDERYKSNSGSKGNRPNNKPFIQIGGKIFDGAKQLADDLYQHLDGRDPYIVGAANIGKSTLTDRCIDNLIQHAKDDGTIKPADRRRVPLTKKEQKRKRYGPNRNMDQRRYEDIQKARVTKSSLPGTTLQNVRVPCFPNHTQALWDTPGLLLDPSLGHYPIKDFRRLKAMRPKRIRPQWHAVEDKRGFALLVLEKEYNAPSSSLLSSDSKVVVKERELDLAIIGENEEQDDGILPLLRIEIRLKKDDNGHGNNKGSKNSSKAVDSPVHLVWNSTLNNVLSTEVTSIEECHSAEKRRVEKMEQEKQQANSRSNGGTDKDESSATDTQRRTPEERAKYKEEKRRQYQEKKQAEIAEMGLEQWNQLQKEEQHQTDRLKHLSVLQKVTEDVILRPNRSMEISIEHFGSLGIVSPAECMVRVFAPSKGIRPVCHPAMAVPKKWEEYVIDAHEDEDEDEIQEDDFVDFNEMGESWDDEDGEIDPDQDGFQYDSGEDDLEDDSWYDEMDEPISTKPDYGDTDQSDDDNDRRWTEFSGENVGWVFDDKPRFVRGAFVDGWNPVTEDQSQGDK